MIGLRIGMKKRDWLSPSPGARRRLQSPLNQRAETGLKTARLLDNRASRESG
jgi:hypothetical protein